MKTPILKPNTMIGAIYACPRDTVGEIAEALNLPVYTVWRGIRQHALRCRKNGQQPNVWAEVQLWQQRDCSKIKVLKCSD